MGKETTAANMNIRGTFEYLFGMIAKLHGGDEEIAQQAFEENHHLLVSPESAETIVARIAELVAEQKADA